METRREENKEYLKYCKNKLNTVPDKYRAFWSRQINKLESKNA